MQVNRDLISWCYVFERLLFFRVSDLISSQILELYIVLSITRLGNISIWHGKGLQPEKLQSFR